MPQKKITSDNLTSDIAVLQQQFIALRELFEQRMTSNDKALQIQAEEYSRRLELLNHAHEQLMEMQAKYVIIDRFERLEQDQKEINSTILVNAGKYYTKDQFSVVEKEYRRIHEALIVSIDDKIARLSADLASKSVQDTIRGRIDKLEIWQGQQIAVSAALEKTTNIKIAVAGLILAVIATIPHFIKFN